MSSQVQTGDRVQIAERAYERLVLFRSVSAERCAMAERLLDDLYAAIRSGDDDVDTLLETFWCGPSADSYAKIGTGVQNKGRLVTFLGTEEPRRSLLALLKLRRANPMGKGPGGRMVQAITHIGLREHVDQSHLLRPKPKNLVNRIVSTIFPDIMTSVASEKDLAEIVKTLGLGIDMNLNLALASVQYQVRSCLLDALGAEHPIHAAHVYEQASLAAWVTHDVVVPAAQEVAS